MLILTINAIVCDIKVFRNALIECVYVVVLLVFIGGLFVFFNNTIKSIHNYKTSNEARGWQFMFMVGQNNDNTGQVGADDYIQEWSAITNTYSDRTDRLNACERTAIKWIRERGLAGNVKYYIKKLNVAFNDGAFHHIEPYSADEVRHDLIFSIYNREGNLFQHIAGIRQILWDFILVMLFWGWILKTQEKNNREVVLKLIIMGIVLYLMIFEGRYKYLYMFLPIFLIYGGIGFEKLKEVYLRLASYT